MIFDKLSNFNKYISIHKSFEIVYDFLKNNDLKNFETGEYYIDEKNIYFSISREEFKNQEKYIEAHRNYIDIQIPIIGTFEVGLKFTDDCKIIKDSYDEKKDIEFYKDFPDSKINLIENTFAIFFPNDAHLPYPPHNLLLKAVFKVKL